MTSHFLVRHVGGLRNHYQIFSQESAAPTHQISPPDWLSHDLIMADRENRPVLKMSRKEGWSTTSYVMEQSKQPIASIKKEAKLFGRSFLLNIGDEAVRISTNLWGNKMYFRNGDRELGATRKKPWSWKATYEVVINDCPQPELILAAIVVIDLFLDNDY